MTAFHFCPPPDLPFLFLFLSICLPFLSLSPAFPSSSLAVDHLTHTLSPSLSSSLSLTRNSDCTVSSPLYSKIHVIKFTFLINRQKNLSYAASVEYFGI